MSLFNPISLFFQIKMKVLVLISLLIAAFGKFKRYTNILLYSFLVISKQAIRKKSIYSVVCTSLRLLIPCMGQEGIEMSCHKFKHFTMGSGVRSFEIQYKSQRNYLFYFEIFAFDIYNMYIYIHIYLYLYIYIYIHLHWPLSKDCPDVLKKKIWQMNLRN